jgi:hypothetical protein
LDLERRFVDLEKQLMQLATEQKELLAASQSPAMAAIASAHAAHDLHIQHRDGSVRSTAHMGHGISMRRRPTLAALETQQTPEPAAPAVHIDDADAETIERAMKKSINKGPWYRCLCLASRSGLGKDMDQLRSSFLEFYRSLVMVQAYNDVNKEGFRKIIKKHDKVTGIKRKEFLVITLFPGRSCL